LNEESLGRIFLAHLLYLDDAGSVPNANEGYYVLGGVSVYEAQADWFSRQLDDLAQTINPADPASVEFHASEIFSRRTIPWKGMTRDDARGVIMAVLKIIADSYASARVFACAVEKASVSTGTDVVELAFEDLCSRFSLYLDRLRAQGDRQRGLVILDRTTRETSLQRLAREFRSLGTRWGNTLRNLADIPFFVDSRASRLIQFADHVAYAVFRRYNAGDTQYFDIIAPRFDAADGRIHGLSHKLAQGVPCLCPACLSRQISGPLSD